jgi:chlorophyll synthase
MQQPPVSLETRSPASPVPKLGAVLELLKPVTWFPPMWAFLCGVVSSGANLWERWPLALAGIILAGPLVCATSQAVNDWFDRHVDAINEPNRPIPSGRIPGRWGLWIAIIGTVISLAWSWALGPWVGIAGVIGLFLAWAYSAPPFRLKISGVWGPGVVGLTYEGLAWFTGAAVMLGALPDAKIIIIALLYSLGAHGIMTLNDFKAVEGDRLTGIRSLPVVMGERRAAEVACMVMAAAQVAVIACLWAWGLGWAALGVAGFLGLQALLMARLMRDAKANAPWYNATGVTAYVLGMMLTAVALADHTSGAGG